MGSTSLPTARFRHVVTVASAMAVLLGCASTSTPPSPAATPGTTEAISRVGQDFLALAGDDIFGDVAAGGGSVWMATLEGLIQVDPETMDATWHTDLAPGQNVVYAFDSVWIGGTAGVIRIDPTSVEEIATIRTGEPEGITADENGIWTSQHKARTVLRIDPRTNEVVESVDVASAKYPAGAPMDPSIVESDVWVAMGNVSEVVRIDADRKVTRIEVQREVLTPGVETAEAVWFSNWLEPEPAITRIDRATGKVDRELLPASAMARPGGVGTAIQVDDTLWFPTSGGTMVAIDTVTFDVLGTVGLQGSVPRKAVEYDGAIWIASEFDGSLERISVNRLAEALAARS